MAVVSSILWSLTAVIIATTIIGSRSKYLNNFDDSVKFGIGLSGRLKYYLAAALRSRIDAREKFKWCLKHYSANYERSFTHLATEG